MAIPATYDECGRLLAPRISGAVKETEEFPRVHNPSTLTPSVIETKATFYDRARRFLMKFNDNITAWASDTGIDADVPRLVLVGLISQNKKHVQRILRRDSAWINPRVDRLRKMGMWVRGEMLGPRFGSWVEDVEYGGLSQLLDCMEVEGMITSRKRSDGELVYQATIDPPGE